MDAPLPFAVQVDPLSERVKTLIGNLMFQNADLQLKVEYYESKIQELTMELNEYKLDKQVGTK